MNWTKTGAIIGVVLGLTSLIGVGLKVDSFYAHADEVKGLRQMIEFTNYRLEQKILNDDIIQQTRMKWTIQDRLKKYPDDVALQNQLREINITLKRLEEEKRLLLENRKEK